MGRGNSNNIRIKLWRWINICNIMIRKVLIVWLLFFSLLHTVIYLLHSGVEDLPFIRTLRPRCSLASYMQLLPCQLLAWCHGLDHSVCQPYFPGKWRAQLVRWPHRQLRLMFGQWCRSSSVIFLWSRVPFLHLSVVVRKESQVIDKVEIVDLH